MIIHGNEIMEPEELSQLGSVFDETWAAIRASTGDGSAELRTALASILLRLAHLRQLGPDQMKATALRIIRAEPMQSVALSAWPPREVADCSASPPQGA